MPDRTIHLRLTETEAMLLRDYAKHLAREVARLGGAAKIPRAMVDKLNAAIGPQATGKERAT